MCIIQDIVKVNPLKTTTVFDTTEFIYYVIAAALGVSIDLPTTLYLLIYKIYGTKHRKLRKQYSNIYNVKHPLKHKTNRPYLMLQKSSNPQETALAYKNKKYRSLNCIKMTKCLVHK